MMLLPLVLGATIATAPVSPGGSVSIDTRDANSWVGSRVRVEGWKRPDVVIDQEVVNGPQSDVRAIVRRNGSELAITAAYEGERKSWLFGLIHQSTGKSFRWVVHVPADRALRVRESDGRIEVSGVTAPLDVQTSNGQIAISGAGPVFDVETSNGTIDVGVATLSGGPPAIKARSSNGWIHLLLPKAFTTRIVTRTANGAVTNPLAAGSGPGTAFAETSNGSINIEING